MKRAKAGTAEKAPAAPAKARKLTDKERLFVAEYLVDLNGTKAAIRAGYSAKTARQAAARLLSNVNIQAAIEAGASRRVDRLEIDADRVVKELARIGFANMQDYMCLTTSGDPYVDFSALTRDQSAAISEITVEDFTDGRGEDAREVKRIKFKLHDKRAALVDLGKHLGLFKDKVELTGKDGGPIEHTLSPDMAAWLDQRG